MPADLFEDHRKITAAADDLLAILRATPDLPIDQVSQMRARLGSLTMAHLRAEEAKIITPLTASGQIEAIPGAPGVLAATRDTRAAYSYHIRRWTPQAIDQDRAGYVAALAKLIDILKIVLEREEAELYWPALKLLAPEATA